MLKRKPIAHWAKDYASSLCHKTRKFSKASKRKSKFHLKQRKRVEAKKKTEAIPWKRIILFIGIH